MKKIKWTALYVPAGKDLSKSFSTKKEATDYAKKHFCKQCKGMESACGCEWLIVETKKLGKCDNIQDAYKAAGWKEIDKKDFFKTISNKYLLEEN